MKFSSCVLAIAFLVLIMLPSHASEPKMQVTFCNWQNNQKGVVKIYSHAQPLAGSATNHLGTAKLTSFAQLTPGANGIPISIPLNKTSIGAILTGIRLIPVDKPRDCVQFYFTSWKIEENSFFEVSSTALHMKSENEQCGLGLGQLELTWKTNNPPQYVNIEIEGNVEESWDAAKVTIKHNIVK